MITKKLDMDIEKKVDFLIELDVEGFGHLSGSLIEHLKGTYLLLDSWGNDIDLCLAGLYHAVYGTSGFDEVLISENHRDKIKKIIGERAEQIVYTYCACDRDFFWPQIGVKTNPIFLDRFTGIKHHLALNDLQVFCELTIANELEIAKNNHDFILQYGQSLKDLFFRMQPYVSVQATCNVEKIIQNIVVMPDKGLITPLTPELCCSNIKTSLAFYTETLGFKIQYQREEDGFVMLERQGSRIMLDEIRKDSISGTSRTWVSGLLEKPFGRGINLEIRTIKVNELYQRVQYSGANIFLPIEEKWYRVNNLEVGNRQFIVLDPDGYMLRFAEDLGKRIYLESP